MAIQRLPSGYLGLRFDARDPAAVALTAKVGMFAAMLMGLTSTGQLFFFGRWGEEVLCLVSLGFLAYGIRRLHLGAALVLLAMPAVAWMAWALRDVSETERAQLLVLKG